MRGLAVVALAVPFLAGAAPPVDPAEPAPESNEKVVPVGRFRVIVHVATDGDGPVLAPDRLDRWVQTAEHHFAPAGIRLAPEVRVLPEGWATLAKIRDRHRLKRFLVPHRINVFILGEILDPVASAATKRAAARAGFEPSGRLAGAHIVAAKHKPGTYVILSAAHGSALAFTHELGHFFGVAHHPAPDNIMSYGSRRSRFDARQLRTFRRRALRYRRARTVEIAPES